MSLRLLVIGVDGASAPVTDRLMAEGRLPNLAALARRGARGALDATFPPHTAPGWASMFTGVSPGKHGVYQFWDTQDPDYGARVCGASDFAREPLWHTLDRHGLAVGVLNVPMTHPPRALRNGYMLSWPLVRTLRYSEPPELVGELARAGVHFQSDLATMFRDQDDYLAQVDGFMRGRTASVRYLLERRPVEALFVVYTEVDRVSHYYWGDESEPSEEVFACYEQMDREIGALVDLVPQDCVVAVASDHGFGHCSQNVYVHAALEDAGLLRSTYVATSSDERVIEGDYSERGGASWFTSDRTYRRQIDWARTRVYMPTPGCFGLNLNLEGRQREGIVREADRGAIAKDVAEIIREIQGPGGPLFEVAPREAVYHGECVGRAPDLVLLPHRWDVMAHPGLGTPLLGPPTQAGIHRREGVLCVAGPGVAEGELGGARIEDVAPTLLSLLGLPAQEELDGRVLFGDAHAELEPRVTWNEHVPTVALSTEDQREADRRLAALGYL
jgi:predicted AlkP superfamily phosphohydrolase/phosphomutase